MVATVSTKKKQSSARTVRSAEDWEEAALDAIAAGGLRSLAIPELAQTLGVTKGSFYWHFPALGDLIAASLRRWETADAAAVQELESVADPRARLRVAFTEARHSVRAHALYVALSASDDARVTASLRRISERRLRFLVTAYEELGCSPAEAQNQAMLTYLAYIGLMHVRKPAFPRLLTAAAMESFVEHAVRTLIPGE
jgi:AcrR family transcriptional regulator